MEHREPMAKIAVIDDSHELRRSLSSLLRNEGYMVAEHNGRDNVGKFVLEERPEVIVLDYLLGGRTGADVVDELSLDPVTARIPILALSAHPSAQLFMAHKGVYAFLSKPCSADSLLKKVEMALKGRYVPSRVEATPGSFT